jgi:hypothetical protein
MKAVAEHSRKGSDFYLSTLAPVNDRRKTRFGLADAVILIVLFVEMGIVMRLFLAN